MVEGAIAGLIFFFVVFLVFQSAFLARSVLAAKQGSTSGARAGAVAAKDAAADFDVLKAVQKAGVAGARGDITTVVVFRATSPRESVPGPCKMSSSNGLRCNTYTNADLDRPISDFGGGGWQADDDWPPRDRMSSRLEGTDYIGVYVEVKTGTSGIFPQTVSDTSITRLEAERY